MRGMFRDEQSWLIYMVDSTKHELSFNEKLFREMYNNCTIGHWESNLLYFYKGIQLSLDKLYRLGIPVYKKEIREVVKSLKEEIKNAELTFKHTEMSSYESDINSFRSAITYGVKELSKKLDYKKPQKKDGGESTITIVRADGTEDKKTVKQILEESKNNK